MLEDFMATGIATVGWTTEGPPGSNHIDLKPASSTRHGSIAAILQA